MCIATQYAVRKGWIDMAKVAKTAWGIDLGNCTLKALKLAVGPETVEVLDFAVIEHEKILSQPEITPETRIELMTKALDKFLEEHDLSNSAVVVSVPGQSSFARFVHLPPMDKKRIPALVPLEAQQQIPFDMKDVEWDWQTLESSASPEIELGIFAIKRDLVRRALEPFVQAGCLVNIVQMAPMALYNFLCYDQKQSRTANEAIITLDIGAENTDLVIVDGTRVWQRSIPLGGNQFTAAVQKAFKLTFAKAEAIKRTANTSKYARQIFQAMRSVFADLAAEVQRSLGFYSSSNREVQFRKVLAMGNAIKLPGLIKFLQQSLSLPVKRLDNFESLKLTPDISVTQFAANLPSLGVAYGLALQGIGQTAIVSNLLPPEITRQAQWRRKKSWFVAAIAVFMLACLMGLVQPYSQKKDINSNEIKSNRSRMIQLGKKIDENKALESTLLGKVQKAKAEIALQTKLYDSEFRNFIPVLFQAVRDAVPNENSNPSQKPLYDAFNVGDRSAIIATGIPRSSREQVFISSVHLVYTDDLNQDFDQIVEKTDTSRSGYGGGRGAGGMGIPGIPPGMFIPGMPSRMPSSRPGSSASPGRPMGPMGPIGGMTPFGPSPGGVGVEKTAEPVPGFVIVIEGSTPHQNGLSFLMPPRVGLDREKWGFFHRLRFLGLTDGEIVAQNRKAKESPSGSASAATSPLNKLPLGGIASGIASKPGSPSIAPTSPATAEQPTELDMKIPDNPQQKAASDMAGEQPFATYRELDDEGYFYKEHGWINGNPIDNQPRSLGVIKPQKQEVGMTRSSGLSFMPSGGTPRGGSSVSSTEIVLIDPLTFEEISETYKRDDKGDVIVGDSGQPELEKHDYWFRVKVKVKLKEKAKPEQKPAGTIKSGGIGGPTGALGG